MVYINTLFYRFALLSIMLSMSGFAFSVEKQMVLGAGPSIAVTTLFFEHFSKNNYVDEYVFEVEQRSIKHAGGIKASARYYFGRTGRPLNEAEKAGNKRDIFLARIPIAIVVGGLVGVKSITLEQLEQIFTGQIDRWSQLGGADHKIILAGRESTEAVFGVLKNDFPFFAKARFDKTLKRDHQVMNLLKSQSGAYAISFGAASNFDQTSRLKVTGFESGVSLGLVYDLSNQEHPLINAVKEYAKSESWIKLLMQNNYLPPE